MSTINPIVPSCFQETHDPERYSVSDHVSATEIIQMAKNILSARMTHGVFLADAVRLKDYVLVHCSDHQRECVHGIFLDAAGHFIAHSVLAVGSINMSMVCMREAVKQALDVGAASMVVIHNHPSGNPNPSEHDREITNRIGNIMKVVDVVLLDHLIVGNGRVYSLAYDQELGDD